jgi:hypothetical protein
MITLTVAGEFTPLELAAFLCLIQGLDRARREDKHWSVNVDDADGATVREAEALLRQTPPPAVDAHEAMVRITAAGEVARNLAPEVRTHPNKGGH